MSKGYKIVRSDDATTVIIKGDRRNPEPSHLIVQFPGGFVEIARCQDDSYWVHTHRNTEACEATEKVPGAVVGSRLDWSPEFAAERSIPQLPAHEEIRGMSIRIATTSGAAA
ncbi:TPA_asm: hypothetical protein Cy-LDV1_g36 [Cyanophage Cy-LDV1]|nr:TPA_asm: hypothetical protein Cy-LDV1_g36 [Cyanophage Cy-LDV1]